MRTHVLRRLPCGRNTLRVLLVAGISFGLSTACRSEAPPTPPASDNSALVPQAEAIGTNVIEEAAFSLRWQPSEQTETSAAPGGQLTGHLVLSPKAPFKNNLEYPYKLKLEHGIEHTGAKPTKAELTKADMEVSAARVVVPVSYTAGVSGEQALTGVFAFSVCTEDKCLIERKKLRMTASASGQ